MSDATQKNTEQEQQPRKDQPQVDWPQETIPATSPRLSSPPSAQARGAGNPEEGGEGVHQSKPLPSTAGGDPQGDESTLSRHREVEGLSSKSNWPRF